MGELEKFVEWISEEGAVDVSFYHRHGTRIQNADLIEIYKSGIPKAELGTLAYLKEHLQMVKGYGHEYRSKGCDYIQESRSICEKYGLSFEDLCGIDEDSWRKECDDYESNKKGKKKREYPGYVYLIKSGDSYKIGRTENVKKRIEGLQTGHHNELELVHSFKTEDSIKEEKRLHEMFHDKHTRGEWFSLSEEDIAYIKSL